jgi:dGTPase
METREGILKHGHDWPHPVRFPPARPHPSAEARVADFADEIAYLNHDLDDGLRSGLLEPKALEEVTLWRETRQRVRERLGETPRRIEQAQTISNLINRLVTDLLEETARRLAGVPDREALHARSEPAVAFSEPVARAALALKRFLLVELYQHPRVLRETRRGEEVLGDLFRAYREDASRLPGHVVARFEEDGESRAVADYVAGMTDRFALDEHRKLLDPHAPI